MDCSDTEPQKRHFYRYTISRLLELASLTFVPFDLSHFSYDAVRAGIIPALAACAMAPGDASNFRGRGHGFSSETTNSENDVAYPSKAASSGLSRQPDRAPTGERRQKDEGFNQFLKKHSSPNHQRVTAGGRIVPMEQRAAPPRFNLNLGRNKRTASDSQQQMLEPFPKLAMDGNYGPPINFQLGGAMSPMMGASAIFPSPTGNFAAMSSGASRGDMGYLVTPAPVSQATYVDSNAYGQEVAAAWGIPFCAPLSQFSTGMTVGVPTYAPTFGDWSYIPQYGALSGSTSPISPSFQPYNESAAYLQQQLEHAQATFDNLGQQLKELDRHRAINPRVDEVVNRRKMIVEERASTLLHVRSLEKALNVGSTQHFLSPVSPFDPTPSHSTASANTGHKFNVEAQAYVPKRSSGSARVDIKAPETHEAMPALPSPHKKTPSVISEPADEGNVDGWGVQLGRAPPDLERQQSQLSEAMLAPMVSPSVSSVADGDLHLIAGMPLDSVHIANMHAADMPTEHVPMEEMHIQSPGLTVAASVAASETSSLGERIPEGRAPPAVERDYEAQLDALRKPKGVSSLVYLSDGRILPVEGLDLQPPAVADMSDFEKEYWFRQTGRGSVAPAELSNTHVNPGILSNLSAGVNALAPNRHYEESLARFKAHNSFPNDDPFVSPIDARSTLAQNTTDVFAEEARHEVDSFDMNNKAFSSVAFQSVNALSRPPQNLDGATDAYLRKVLQPDQGSSKKAKSPKLLYRSKSPGDSWYGPFRRNFFDPGNPDNDYMHK